jgi:glycosyltransferase involved in cell wall biosynthesis
VGVVVIGRNEGRRLSACLESVRTLATSVVYVDSGSTDDSVARARQVGADVVDLDMNKPFTAARARNEGFRRLRSLTADIDFVQFVDGDCTVAPGWIEAAVGFLDGHAGVAVVCGRRRERHPEQSVYNELCDIEWDTPVGPARACGGDAMMRAQIFDAVGGFDGSLVAGEEPELCVRIRRAGWQIERLPDEMTLHDADMHRFGQWWKRSVRAGFAFAEGARLHGRSDGHFVPELGRIVFWAGALPAGIAVTLLPTLGASSLGFLGYGVSAARTYRRTLARGKAPRTAVAYAVACTIGKFPEMQGVLRYAWLQLRGERATLIEYKGPG